MRSGNMVTRIIIINIIVFMVTTLLSSLLPIPYEAYIAPWIELPGDFMTFITRPWTLITHMFIHSGLRHIFWNMLMLYWFGRIAGDRIGDKHIWPIYLLGGLAGAVAYLASFPFVYGSVQGTAVGASAAIMALVIVAGRINPDYEMRLLFLGNVKIKFIVVALIFIDLMMISKDANTGGHIAHLGGMVFGWLYYNQIGGTNDLETNVNGWTAWIASFFNGSGRKPKKKKSPLSVKYKSEKIKTMSERRQDADDNLQSKVDAVLDKIKKKGYNSLTDAEKEILYKASKN